jgi:Uma2 family endonuclease
VSGPSTRGTYSLQDWLAQPEEAYLELVDGELIEKAAPGFDHGVAQGNTITAVGGQFGGPSGIANRPGGWWLSLEVDVLLDGNVFRPDIAGWRRERLADRPKLRPVTVRPDWICEILSESNRRHDTVVKLRHYHQAGVPHYWIVDGAERTLTVHRHTVDGYLVAMRADASARVRAEPFDAIELDVAVLLGDDPVNLG